MLAVKEFQNLGFVERIIHYGIRIYLSFSEVRILFFGRIDIYFPGFVQSGITFLT